MSVRSVLVILVAGLLSTAAFADKSGRAKQGSAGERTVITHVNKLEKGMLHVAIGDVGTDVIVPTTDKTEIRIDGAAAKLSDLTPGMLAEITQVDGETIAIDCKRLARGR